MRDCCVFLIFEHFDQRDSVHNMTLLPIIYRQKLLLISSLRKGELQLTTPLCGDMLEECINLRCRTLFTSRVLTLPQVTSSVWRKSGKSNFASHLWQFAQRSVKRLEQCTLSNIAPVASLRSIKSAVTFSFLCVYRHWRLEIPHSLYSLLKKFIPSRAGLTWISLSSLLAAMDVSDFPCGEERGKTAVFAGQVRLHRRFYRAISFVASSPLKF